jgi:hypothetical protein
MQCPNSPTKLRRSRCSAQPSPCHVSGRGCSLSVELATATWSFANLSETDRAAAVPLDLAVSYVPRRLRAAICPDHPGLVQWRAGAVPGGCPGAILLDRAVVVREHQEVALRQALEAHLAMHRARPLRALVVRLPGHEKNDRTRRADSSGNFDNTADTASSSNLSPTRARTRVEFVRFTGNALRSPRPFTLHQRADPAGCTVPCQKCQLDCQRTEVLVKRRCLYIYGPSIAALRWPCRSVNRPALKCT